MLPDESDHAKGRLAVAAKKVCKLMRHDARARRSGGRPAWCAACKARCEGYRRLSASRRMTWC